ncbi:MAG: PASTA domain-containing protein, partial [Gaiellaceae bacterium]
PDVTITLTVSKGPQTVSVPPVVGFDAGSAESTITDAGLKYRPIRQDTLNIAESDTVISQDPAGGVEVALGSTVKVYIGNYIGP